MNLTDLYACNRVMIIFWKWRHPQSNDRLTGDYDIWPVIQEGGSAIVRFDPVIDRGPKEKKLNQAELIQCLDDLQDSYLSNTTGNTQIQLFLHASDGFGLDILEKSKLNTLLAKETDEGQISLDVFLFQNGESDIYLVEGSPLGLIGINGKWGESIINGEVIRSKDGNMIKKDHFEFVWELFKDKSKKRIYNAAQHFYRGIYTLSEPDLSKILILFNDFLEKIETVNLQRSPDKDVILNQLRTILASLSADPNSLKSLLPKVRTAVNTTIEKLPGSQVYV